MESESAEPQPFPSAADVDAVLAEFGGDPRAAIAALLHDVAALAADYELSVSRGYVRRGTGYSLGRPARDQPGGVSRPAAREAAEHGRS